MFVVVFTICSVAVILLTLFIWMMCKASSMNPDAIRDGHETVSWEERASRQAKTVKAIKIILTGCISAYLPVSRTAVQIFVCDATLGGALAKLDIGLQCTQHPVADGDLEPRITCSCADWNLYVIFQIAAGVLFLLITILLPIKCYQLIKANKPRGSKEDPDKRWDEDGTNLIDYTDAMYHQDIMTSPEQQRVPYLFLYKGELQQHRPQARRCRHAHTRPR